MKKIVLIPNPTRDPEFEYTQKAEVNLINRGFQVCRYTLDDPNLCERDFFNDSDAILVLGGDGTILNAAHIACRYDLPILAINLGKIGFIAQLEKNDLDRIPDILTEAFITEERAMLSIALYRNGCLIFQNESVLNDAVIGKMEGRGIIEADLVANETPVNHYRGDGIILSTATGSTAYSMSAGGPILDPTLKTITVTPLANHSLKSRPIVFSDGHTLTIRITPANASACLTLDGENTIPLEADDAIRISISSKTTKLITQDNNFGKILYKKMSDL